MKRDTRELKDRLLEARENTNLSQDDVAKAVGISQPVYSELERGIQAGTAKIVEIADVLRVSPRWLAMGLPETDQPPAVSELEKELIELFRSDKKIKKELLERVVDWRESRK